MSKSPQYNQKTEPKQGRSDVEEICITNTRKEAVTGSWYI